MTPRQLEVVLAYLRFRSFPRVAEELGTTVSNIYKTYQRATLNEEFIEKQRAYSQKYYQQNRERTLQRVSDWKKRNPQKVKAQRKRRYDRQKSRKEKTK